MSMLNYSSSIQKQARSGVRESLMLSGISMHQAPDLHTPKFMEKCVPPSLGQPLL